MGGDESREPERSERAAVVGHDRDHGQDLAGLDVDAAVRRSSGGRTWLRSRPTRARRRRSRRTGSRSVRHGIDARTSTSSRDTRQGQVPPEVVSNSEKSSCRTWFGPVATSGESMHIPTLGKLAAFALVTAVRQRSDHGRAAGAAPWPSIRRGPRDGIAQILAVTPGRVRQRVLVDQIGRRVPRGLRPRSLRLAAGAGFGLPATPGPIRACSINSAGTSWSTCRLFDRRDHDAVVLKGPIGPPRISSIRVLDRGLAQCLARISDLGLEAAPGPRRPETPRQRRLAAPRKSAFQRRSTAR